MKLTRQRDRVDDLLPKQSGWVTDKTLLHDLGTEPQVEGADGPVARLWLSRGTISEDPRWAKHIARQRVAGAARAAQRREQDEHRRKGLRDAVLAYRQHNPDYSERRMAQALLPHFGRDSDDRRKALAALVMKIRRLRLTPSRS